MLSGKLDGLEEDSMTLADNIRSFDDETLAQFLTKIVSNTAKASGAILNEEKYKTELMKILKEEVESGGQE